MLKFYRDAIVLFVMLTLLSASILLAGYLKSQIVVYLFPARDDALFWRSSIEPKEKKGETQLVLKNEVGTVEYEFFLDPEKPFPYAHYSQYFADAAHSFQQIDLTRYNTISFQVNCDPKNVLLFVLFSFDDKVTDLRNPISRRVSSTAFSCSQSWSEVTLRLDDLETPQWWLSRFGLEYSEKAYRLDKAMGFAWANSLQSPSNIPSNVKLTNIKLTGSDQRYLYVACICCVFLWVLFFAWQLRRYTAVLTSEIKSRVMEDQPLIAYKKLSIAPQKNKEKIALLRYMATQYTDPDLSLEVAAASLGINRNKINDILKEELSLTFSTYLNKLRLSEAARLLSENLDVNVSEIAYSVGYNNVSYFNKVFKQEYGCAPKTFKSLYQSESKN
jgi:AraC-like DNA-binding protein